MSAAKLRDALTEIARELPEDTARMVRDAAAGLERAGADAVQFVDHLFRGSAAGGALQLLPAEAPVVPAEPEADPDPEVKPKPAPRPRPAAVKPSA